MKGNPEITLDPFTEYLFEIIGEDFYLVGGYPRDLFLKRPSKDWDFAGPEKKIKEITMKIKKLLNATEVSLKGTTRLVLRDGGIIDITPIEGPSIESDLMRRDFTINAIALNKYKELIDPASGLKDLRNKLIRAVRLENLLHDPVRILRAFRFSSELDFDIERQTLNFIEKNREKCLMAAGERITLEFFYFLQGKAVLKHLRRALTEGPAGVFFSLNINKIDEMIKKLSHTIEKLKVSPEIREELRFWPLFETEAMILFFGLILYSDRIPDIFVLPENLKKELKRFKSCINKIPRTLKEVFDFFEAYKRAGLMYLYLEGKEDLINYYWHYRDILKNPPVRGDELIARGIPPGPELTEALREARRKEFLKRISS